MSTRLSVVMIAKNAADLLPDCLASVAWADEIVILDSGSTDNTVDVARAAGAKVFVDADWQGYGIQRQRAQEGALGRVRRAGAPLPRHLQKHQPHARLVVDTAQAFQRPQLQQFRFIHHQEPPAVLQALHHRLKQFVHRAGRIRRRSDQRSYTVLIPIALNQVGRLKHSFEPGLIWRRDRLPTITVRANLYGKTQPATIVDRLQPEINAIQAKLPEGYRIVTGGTVEESAKGSGSVMAGIPLFLLAVVTILLLLARLTQRNAQLSRAHRKASALAEQIDLEHHHLCNVVEATGAASWELDASGRLAATERGAAADMVLDNRCL